MQAADVAESSPKPGARAGATLRILVERCHFEQCEPEIGHPLYIPHQTPCASDRSSSTLHRSPARARYFTSVSILNIGRYIAMMITPTMQPTPIIMIGSMIDVSDATDASTSSS